MDGKRSQIRYMTRGYFFAIGLIAILFFTVYLSLVYTLKPLQFFGRAMNQVGEQKRHVERVAWLSLRLVSPGDLEEQATVRLALRRSLRQLERFQKEQSVKSVSSERLVSYMGGSYKEVLKRVQVGLGEFSANTYKLLKTPTFRLTNKHPLYVQNEEITFPTLIASLDGLGKLLETEWEGRVNTLEKWATVAQVFILVILALIAVVVFRPLLKRVKRDEEIQKATNEALEERAKQLMASEEALESQVRLSESILNSMGDGVVVVDKEGTIILMNPSAKRIFERSLKFVPNEEKISDLFKNLDIYRPDLKEKLSVDQVPLLRAIRNGEQCNHVGFFVKDPDAPFSDGVFLNSSATALHDGNGNIRGGVSVFRDITEEKRAFQSLHASEKRFRELITGANEVIYTVDTHGRIQSLNPAFEKLLGWSPDDWLGKRLYDLIHPDDLPIVMARFEKSMKGESLGLVEFRVQHKDGSYCTLETHNATPTYDGDKIVGFWGIAHDITARKRVEQELLTSQELFFKSFHATPSAIGIASLGGALTHVNESFVKLVGLTREDIIGRDAVELGLWGDNEKRKAMLESLEKNKGSVRNVELTMQRRTGEIRHLVGSFELILLRSKPSVLGMLRDVTEERLAQQRLQEAKEAADLANRAKSDFLANVSHELRTPLAAVLGYLEMGGKECKAVASATDNSVLKCQEYRERIRHNVKNLVKLIDDILDISKIEAGKLDIKKASFPFLSEMGNLLLLLKDEAQAKGLSFDVRFDGAIPEVIDSDPVRVRQILMNVVGNAIKFTSNGFVRVTFKMVEAGNGRVRDFLAFMVDDSGCGIDPKRQDQLFMPFTQMDSTTTRKYGGTGLGLNLSRKLARRLGGDLVLVSSEIDRGSVFKCILDPGPLEGARYIEHIREEDLLYWKPAKESEENISLEGLHVLVVEDGPDNQEVITHFLKEVGAKVDLAENGIEGVKKAQSRRYDVVLMDVQMPLMSGYQATQLLRKEGYGGVILALTAAAMKGEREKCLAAGFNDYLTKPFERSTLVRLVDQHANGVVRHAAERAENSGKLEAKRKVEAMEKEPLYSIYRDDPRVAPIIKGFVQRLAERSSSMQKAFKEANWEQLGQLAHKIKGAAGGYGFPTLTHVAEKIETMAKDDVSPEKLRPLMEDFSQQCERAAEGLEASQ